MMAKQEMRRAALDKRALLNPAWGAALAEHVLARCPPRPGEVWAGFWPMGSEIDIRPLLHELAARVSVCLPVTPPRGHPLTFRRWRPGDALTPGPLGTQQPVGDPVIPGVLLVPLLAWDQAGRRLGYGGGYYDRTIAAARGIRTIGCAFAAQEVDIVPTDPHDARLDAIATERGVVFCKGDPS